MQSGLRCRRALSRTLLLPAQKARPPAPRDSQCSSSVRALHSGPTAATRLCTRHGERRGASVDLSAALLTRAAGLPRKGLACRPGRARSPGPALSASAGAHPRRRENIAAGAGAERGAHGELGGIGGRSSWRARRRTRADWVAGQRHPAQRGRCAQLLWHLSRCRHAAAGPAHSRYSSACGWCIRTSKCMRQWYQGSVSTSHTCAAGYSSIAHVAGNPSVCRTAIGYQHL